MSEKNESRGIPMSQFESEIVAYLKAGFPGLYIQTFEEARVEHAIKNAANHGALRRSVFVWSVTRGWVEMTADSRNARTEMTTDPKRALEVLMPGPDGKTKLGEEGVFVLRDFHFFMQSPQIIRLFRDLMVTAKQRGQTIVVVSPVTAIPPELEKEITLLTFDLPTREELNTILNVVVESVGGEKNAKIEDRPMLLEAARGQTASEAENTFALALAKHQALGAEALKTVQREKANIIKKTGIMEFYNPDVSMDDIGGLHTLKEWVSKRRRLLTDDAVAYGFDRQSVRVLIVGVPGVGKSLAAKAIAALYNKPLIRFDVGRVFGSLVGESLHPSQELYLCDNAGRNVHRMTIEQLYRESVEHGVSPHWYTWTYTDYGSPLVKRVTDVMRHVRRERFLRVRTRSGRSVIVTEGHSLFVRRKREGAAFPMRGANRQTSLQAVETRDLKIGDAIAVVRHLGAVRKYQSMARRQCRRVDVVQRGALTFEVTSDLAMVFGLYLGDGSLNNGRVRISCDNRDRETLALLRRLYPSALTEYRKGAHGLDITINDRTLALLAHTFDVCRRGANSSSTKRVPDWVFGCSNEIIAAYLRGYFSADGGAHQQTVEAFTMSPRLAEDVALLLSRLGIFARLYRKGGGTRIVIKKGMEVRQFAQRVGFLQSRKQARLRDLSTQSYEKHRTSRGVLWDEVVVIEAVNDRERYSYDISVEKTEKFVAHGIVVHNSERNIRHALAIAEACAPDVLWFDELEKGFAGMITGSQSDGGVGARVLGTLLTWWQECTQPVSIVATANDVESLPGALLRRFDEIFFADLPRQDALMEVFPIHLRKRRRDPDKFDIAALARQADQYSGAEVEKAVIGGMIEAFDAGKEVTTEHILYAIKKSPPLAQVQPKAIESIREWARKHKARDADEIVLSPGATSERARRMRV